MVNSHSLQSIEEGVLIEFYSGETISVSQRCTFLFASSGYEEGLLFSYYAFYNTDSSDSWYDHSDNCGNKAASLSYKHFPFRYVRHFSLVFPRQRLLWSIILLVLTRLPRAVGAQCQRCGPALCPSRSTGWRWRRIRNPTSIRRHRRLVPARISVTIHRAVTRRTRKASTPTLRVARRNEERRRFSDAASCSCLGYVSTVGSKARLSFWKMRGQSTC